MVTKNRYTLLEVEKRLATGNLPFSGITALGSTHLKITKPAFYIGVAMHAGSRVRPDIREALAVSSADQVREEDPHMDKFIAGLPIQLKSLDSRFEYDVNREYERGIYDEHKQSWGLNVWRRELTTKERERSLAKHQEFHELVDILLSYLLEQFKHVVVFDTHSYCYQREERRPWYDDPKPEINIGTKAVNHALFDPLIIKFKNELTKIEIDSRRIRVRENDIFFGGHLSRRLSREHHDNVLVLAQEFKKIFMDEWSGEVYVPKLTTLINGYQAAIEKLVADAFFA